MCVRIDVALSRQKVLEVILDHKKHGKPVTRDAIAQTIGCHPITVWRAIQDLQHAGQIRMTQRGRGYVTTEYEVLREGDNADNSTDA